MKKITFLLFTFFTISAFSQNKLTSSLSEFYDGTTWLSSDKTEFKYDGNNNLVEELQFTWNFLNSQWMQSALTTYTYNANNKVVEEVREEYSQGVTYKYKTSYSFNSSGDIIQFLDQDWENNTWVNEYKLDITYNANNKIVSGLSYDWINGAWALGEDSSQTTITYNANGTINISKSDSWNGSIWVNDYRELYGYDANNRIILQDGETWNGAQWENDYRIENTFDANGNAIKEKESFMDNGVFVVSSDETIVFDTSELMSDYAHPFKDKTGLDFLFSANGIVNKILKRTSDNYRTIYNYNGATANIDKFNALSFTVYPNPTTSVIKVDDSSFTIKNMEVFNLLGKKLMSSTKNELNLQRLVKGVYLIKIEDVKGNFATKRIIKN